MATALQAGGLKRPSRERRLRGRSESEKAVITLSHLVFIRLFITLLHIARGCQQAAAPPRQHKDNDDTAREPEPRARPSPSPQQSREHQQVVVMAEASAARGVEITEEILLGLGQNKKKVRVWLGWWRRAARAFTRGVGGVARSPFPPHLLSHVRACCGAKRPGRGKQQGPGPAPPCPPSPAKERARAYCKDRGS